jgi:hypothetical protein
LNSEELITAPKEVLQQMFTFIGVDSKQEITDLQSRNQGSNKQKVTDEVYAQLSEFFNEPIISCSNIYVETLNGLQLNQIDRRNV